MNENSQFEAVHMDIFAIPVHPAADAFPMMEEEELEELACDIKDNGLQQPLVVDTLNGTPLLIDGRNRREACRRAGIVPDHVLLDGQDPVAYILSANINRRHMTKGQRAIVVARVTGNLSVRQAADATNQNRESIRQARFVLNHASDLADSVRSGTLSLDNAFEEARIRKGRADTHEARFNALKEAAPDLADRVVEEKLSLEEAEAEERERADKERQRKRIMVEALHALARHSYLFLPNWHPRVVDSITHDQDLYKQHNAGPVEEFIEALEVFAEHAGPLLARINELKAEKANAESNSQGDVAFRGTAQGAHAAGPEMVEDLA